MKLSKILAVLMACLMMFAAAGCGGGNEEPDLTEDGKRILKVEYLKAGYGTEVFVDIANQFMTKYPDVQVQLYPNETVDGDTETKLTSGKNIRDVYYVSSWGAIRRWAVKGYVHDITDVYSQEVENGKTLLEKIMPHAKNSCILYDKYWALPNEASVNGFIYNATMFEENGWEVPTTTKEFIDLCNTIVNARLEHVDENGKKTKITPMTFGGSGNDGYFNAILQLWWLQYSGPDAIDTFAKFESPEVYKQKGRLEALKVYKEIVFEHLSEWAPDGVRSKTANDAQLEFLLGKAAMVPCGSWFETEMKGWLQYSDIEYKMMQTPFISNHTTGEKISEVDTNTQYLWDGSNASWFIPEAANNKADAENWIKFLATDAALTTWTKLTGGVRPYYYDTSKDSEVYKGATTFAKSLMDLWNASTPYKFITTDKKAILGYATLWPQEKSPFVTMSTNTATTAQQYYDADYTHVTNEWDYWLSVTQG